MQHSQPVLAAMADASVDAVQPSINSFVFEVVRHRGHWRTLHRARHSSPCSDQAAAIRAAKKLARLKRGEGHPVEVILRRTDGNTVVQSIDDDECCAQ